MTEQVIDEKHIWQLEHDEALHSLADLCRELIADKRRLDWLEENGSLGEDEDSDGNVYDFRTSEWVTFADSREEKPQSLREAIDERMRA